MPGGADGGGAGWAFAGRLGPIEATLASNIMAVRVVIRIFISRVFVRHGILA